jgi:transcriptional regulator with XRE-family HTH domain
MRAFEHPCKLFLQRLVFFLTDLRCARILMPEVREAPNVVDLDQAKRIMERFTAKNRGKDIRKLRKEVGLSLDEFGALVGLSGAMISRFERGLNDLSLPAFARVQDAIVDLLSEKKAKKKLDGLRRSEAARKLVSIFPPENFGRIGNLASLKDPAAAIADLGTNRETHERVQSKLIEEQAELIRIQRELLALHGERAAEQDSKIADLEKRIFDLRDLLGLETGATVLRVKADEKREQLTVAGMRKENAEPKE